MKRILTCLALLCLSALAYADTLTICAVSGRGGTPELFSFVAADSSGGGFAAFYLADGTWIDGDVLDVTVVPGGTSTVHILGFLNDATPVLCTLTVTEGAGNANPFPLDPTFDNVNKPTIALSIDGGESVAAGSNLFGWLTESK